MIKIDAKDIHYKELNERIRQEIGKGVKDIRLINVCGQRYIGDGITAKNVTIHVQGVPGEDMAAFMDGPKIIVENNGESLAVLVKDGLLNPSTEFGLEFYLIEGGISSLEKSFDNLSINPTDDNYFVSVINADSDSDFLIKATDLNIGGSKVAGQRPSNYANEILALTDVQLTTRIDYAVLNSAALAKMKTSLPTIGSEIIKDKLIIKKIQPEGKKPMAMEDFLRGHHGFINPLL